MEYSESLMLEIINKPDFKKYIAEENVKGKRTNKDVKIGKSFQYSSKTYENRFLLWNSDNNLLTITEYSTDFELLGNQIEIEFQKSQVLSVDVFETDNDIQFLIATSLLVMRFSLHHPKKLRHPNSSNFNYSIFYGINDLNEMKQCITPYFNANEITSVSCIIDFNNNNDAYFNYGLANGNIYTFVIQESMFPESFVYYEMKEGSLFSKILSGFLPKQRSADYTDISVLDMAYVEISNQLYLVTVSKDNRLKLWSLRDRYCVASEDLLSPVLMARDFSRSQSTINYNSIISSHRVRSFLNSSINEFSNTVLVYFHISYGKLSFSNWLVIQLINPLDKITTKQPPVQILSNINDSGDRPNLIDFEIGYSFSKRDQIGVWSLVSESIGDGNLTYSMSWTSLLDEDENLEKCLCRVYNESNKFDVHIEDHQDSQEAILNKIFTPATFSRKAVVNTINKYLHQLDTSMPSEASIHDMKLNLVLIVESRVEEELISSIEQDVNADVLDLKRKQWFHIFQEIVEEHGFLMEPLGIISVAGTVGIIRYGTVSLMRYPNEFEQIISSNSITKSLFKFYDHNSVVSGCTLLKFLNNYSHFIQTTEVWSSMEYQIFQLGMNPCDISRHFLSICFDVPSVISSRLDNQPEIIEKTVKILETLDIVEIFNEIESHTDSYRMSSFSMVMLHFSTCQMIRDRICISIAMITLIVPRIVNSSQSEHLQELVKRLERLVKSLVSMYWLLTLRQTSSPELTDLQKSQLESLNFSEKRCPNSNGSDILCLRILKSVQNKVQVMHSHANRGWPSKMTEQMLTLITYLHPNSEMFSLYQICKYFLSYNMPLELINYLKFLQSSEPSGWWTGDESFVNMAMGLAYLLLNKPWKVVDCLTDAIYKNEIASSLIPAVIFSEEVTSSMTSLPILQASIILKFIDVMENMSNPEPYLITMAELGKKVINESECEDNELMRCKSILLTILFKNLSEISQFDEARLTIMDNPDKDKQRDCLRQFIIILSEQSELNLLVQFDYGSLSEEFVNIMQSRARASDLNIANNPFYYALYSYHIKNNDYKSAATCMLELALRLDEDLKIQGIYMTNEMALKHLQLQAKSYLTCISVTSLLSVDEQLFVFPASLAMCFSKEDEKICHRKNQQTIIHDMGDCRMDISEDLVDTEEGTERVIINLKQLKQQYNLIKCRLKLLRESPEHGFIQTGKLTKSLTLSGLLQIGLYWDAIKLCLDLDMGMEPVVSMIANRSVQVYKHCLDRPLMKEKENVIDSLEEINPKIDFASLGSLQKLLWRFLEEVLNRFDSTPNGDLCLKACSKLLSGGMEILPPWLISLVNDKKNASGPLLRLYITHGYLEPAIELASRVLDNEIATLSLLDDYCIGKSLKVTQRNMHPLRWVSYPVIFSLIDILSDMSRHNCSRAEEMRNKLEEKMSLMVNMLNRSPAVAAIEAV